MSDLIMKALFPEYSLPSNNNYAEIWKGALFVFDTNVLLNVYRYHSTTRDELLKVLEDLRDDIWIPHHVALEFYRNRLNVIAEQNNRFSEVQKMVTRIRDDLTNQLAELNLEKRHSLIDPTPLVEGFKQLVSQFFESLEGLKEKQQKLSGPDPLRERIEQLFEGHVGQSPKDQNEVDKLFKEAELRFRVKIPPGYMDEEGKKECSDYTSGGLIYKAKYGDYILWKQMLSYAKEKRLQAVIFITDDNKEDWWWKVKSQGEKKIGARVELVEEARREAGVNSFLMYMPEHFLKYAKEFLKADVSDETLDDIRSVSALRYSRKRSVHALQSKAIQAEQAIEHWLSDQYDSVLRHPSGFPTFIALGDNGANGFEVKLAPKEGSSNKSWKFFVRRIVSQLKNENDKGIMGNLNIVIIVSQIEDIEEIKKAATWIASEIMVSQLRIIVGALETSMDGKDEFVHLEDIDL